MKIFFYKIPLLNKIIKQRDELLRANFLLEDENRKLMLEKQKLDYFKDIFLSPWTDAWKIFNNENFIKIPEMMNMLKSGMDKESKNVVDMLWEKIVYLIPYNRYKKSFLYRTDDFFSKKEQEEQKEKIELLEYKFPHDVSIEEAIFKTKNGLIFLDDEILGQIKNKAIIDGGGYIGDSALAFCFYNPSKIYSFEPVDFLCDKLFETIKLNNVEKIIKPIKLGLSNKEKKVEIFGIDSGASLYTSQKGTSQIIKTTTIDKFVSSENIKVGLIKLDVEGSELDVIYGSLETIKKYKPILLISVYHRPEDFFYIKPLIENLSLGYKFMMRKTSPFRVTSETVLIGYVKK